MTLGDVVLWSIFVITAFALGISLGWELRKDFRE